MELKKLIDKLNLSYVHRRIGHHASHSGYNTVFEYMAIPKANSKWMETFIRLLPDSLKWRLHLLRPQAVGDDGLIPELLALPTTRSKKKGICHFIYGEDTYFYTPTWKRNEQKIIATFHYPPQRLIERVSVPVVKTLDAVILMANNQKQYFQRYLPDEKIFVIPHHVDTDFFVPLEAKPTDGKIHIVSVGGILRDMDLLLKTVKTLNTQIGEDNLIFDFLIPKTYDTKFENFNNVILHSKISDEKLRELYQNATIGFMPLEDCTANNAILEMMACGTAIVCSDVGGIGDYIDTEGAIMFDPKQPVEQIVRSIVRVLKNHEKLHSMATHNRAKALSTFSINNTIDKLLTVYQTVQQR